MSWESPIEIIVNQIESAWMDETFRVIQKVGINVDRNELIKALQYDRNQYEKGYEDGINDSQIIRCKNCKHLFDGEHNANCCELLMRKAKWLIEITVDPNGYCDGGRKRDEKESEEENAEN